jgi:hypothetical protein
MCRQRAGLVFVVTFSKQPAGHGKGLRGPRVKDPWSNTISTHAHISIHTLKPVVNISSGNLLLNEKFNDVTLMK